jgi:hypothetical protein
VDSRLPCRVNIFKKGSVTYALGSDGSEIRKGSDQDVFSAGFAEIANGSGDIWISHDNYALTEPISNFPYQAIYEKSQPIIVHGNGSNIAYSGSDWLFSLTPSDGRVSLFPEFYDIVFDYSGKNGGIFDMHTSQSLLENIRIRSNGLDDGCIRYGTTVFGWYAMENVARRLLIENSNYAIKMGKSSQVVIEGNSQIGGMHPIYGSPALLTLRNVNLDAPSDGFCIELLEDTGYCYYSFVYADAGYIKVNGGTHHVISSIVPPFQYSNGSVIYYDARPPINGSYVKVDSLPDNSAIPRHLCPLFIQSYSSWLGNYGRIVSDSDSSGGQARTNVESNATSFILVATFGANGLDFGWLPRGKYLIDVRLKDDFQVENDCRLDIYHLSPNTVYLSKSLTLSPEYRHYMYIFSVGLDSVGKVPIVAIVKQTSENNNIYVDYIKIRYLGSEFSDPASEIRTILGI